MIEFITLNSREEWLEKRKSYIGGSDAGAVVGMNPYKTNVELWEEKTGRKEPEDISEKDFVKYGTEAEKFLRELFKMDFPEYEVGYKENNMFLNSKYPFAHASLDGWLKDKDGRMGVLEIKTTNIMQSAQKEKWKDRVPDSYFCQLLHCMAVTGFDFAVLKSQQKYNHNGDIFLVTKHYHFERFELQQDIDYLMQKEKEIAEYIKNDKEPALILPNF